jgi:hypothetical protein
VAAVGAQKAAAVVAVAAASASEVEAVATDSSIIQNILQTKLNLFRIS